MAHEEKQKPPLYQRIAHELESEILRGVRPAGSRLPSEGELCQQWQVSSITVRRSLLELAKKGLIEKRRGGRAIVAQAGAVGAGDNASRLLGFVVPNSGGYQNGVLLEVAETAARRMGYSLIVKHSQNDAEEEAACVEMLRAEPVAGMIIVPVSGGEEHTLLTYSRLIYHNVPFVLLDRYLPVLNCNFVTSDNERGGYEAARHLLELGHQRIAHVHTYSESAVDARIRGYQRVLEEAGLQSDPNLSVCVGYDEESVRAGLNELFAQSHGDFTALFASNDGIAQVAYAEFHDRGIRVPEDVSVVGHDDAPYSAFLQPPLTTVRQSAEEMSLAAVNLLMDLIVKGTSDDFSQVVLGQDLIVRQSTARNKKI